MSLFQKSVINKYLKSLDQDEVEKAWVKYSRYFQNDIVQETIRNSKEEEYQAGFLDDLFVNILGYTLKPHENFNLVLERKNVGDSKKADGAILKDGKVISVIELKGTNTTDLSKIESQAFGYMINQPGAKYVMTSNFEKLRFYIENPIEFEEFNLFTLTREQFEVLFICLHVENLQSDLPRKIKLESVSEDEKITKKLYKDYSSFRSELFDSIQKLNPDYDKLTLFKKTQKLLDRFLFIFFAEDRLLIQPNTISKIVNKWKTLQEEFDEYFPLYDRFRKYFNYLNDGYKNEVFAYNGGLFVEDEILDSIQIDDAVLEKHTMKLTAYDFESDVDVNIIGHIFEHSLNEIEEIQAELDGQILEKSKSKRKRDGVFYTPKYITKYIVDNTVGKLCEDKKKELEINDEDYEKERKGRRKDTIKKLLAKLESYRKWLLQITICDPACGSGAFLNQALEFLIAEHSLIDELQAKLLDEGFIIQNIENEILEHNLFGVDINDEAVEIAKLSLWLRTARKGRKLTTLSGNIKCGNSLIDDSEVAGEKAFNWEMEFPEIFANGGFDVVIGNPPYVRVQNLEHSIIDWYKENMKSAYKRVDISILFIEKSFQLINDKGLICYITSNQFLKAEYGKRIRELLERRLILNLDFSDAIVFEGLATYVSIFCLSKNVIEKVLYNKVQKEIELNNLDFIEFEYKNLTDGFWDFNPYQGVKTKIYNNSVLLDECVDFVYGIITGNDESFILYTRDVEEYNIEKGVLLKFVKPNNYKRYHFKEFDKYIIYPYDSDNNIINEVELRNSYPNAYDFLYKNKSTLENRKDSRTTIKEKGIEWYSIMRRVHPIFFSQEKIIFYDVGDHPNFNLDRLDCSFGGGTSHSMNIKSDVKLSILYLLLVLNSKVLKWIIYDICPVKLGGARKYGLDYMRRLPIKKISPEEQQPFIEKANIMLDKNKELQEVKSEFLDWLKDTYQIEKLSKKLDAFETLELDEFTKELKKKLQKEQKNLKPSQLSELKKYFIEYKGKAQELNQIITQTDNKIDQMVYELYELSPEEIKIVEDSL